MRRLAPRLAILLVFVLVAAACGDDDDDDAAKSGDASASEDVASEDTAADATDSEASVSFVEPKSGATVARRFVVAMKATGIDIEPAAEGVREGAGHFHVMVDTPCVEPGETIPKDAQHVHFGNGRSEGQLFLEPGEHELCLQVGDGAHTALDVTDEMAVTVDAEQPYVTLGIPEGETLTSPVAVTMEAVNFEIEPAGAVRDGAGHFHLLIDRGCMGPGETIPKDDSHLHFGDGSTKTEVELTPGEHVLCLQVGNGAHAALPFVHFVTVVIK